MLVNIVNAFHLLDIYLNRMAGRRVVIFNMYVEDKDITVKVNAFLVV